MNNNCIYFVEGACEEKLINALKKRPELILPGKVIIKKAKYNQETNHKIFDSTCKIGEHYDII